jgi:hypothetical protein
MPKTMEPWSLTSLREKLIKIGGKVVSHGRYVMFHMAEVAVSRQMFQEILALIARLRAPPGASMRGAGVRCDRRRRPSAPGCRQSRAFQCLGAVNWRFDALPRMRCTICRCRTCSKERSWSPNHPESGECRFIRDRRGTW